MDIIQESCCALFSHQRPSTFRNGSIILWDECLNE